MVAGEQRLEDVEVQAALQVYGVGDRAGREELEGDRDVAEGQVEVDDADLLVARCSVSASARLTASVVLPTPPLGEKTVTWRPRAPSAGGGRRRCSACQTCWARVTAAPSPVRSRSSTTSRMPERRASASTLVSTRRRIRMTLIAGRVTRSVSARAAAASRSTAGPSTMAYSFGDSARSRLSSSRLPTTCESRR